MLGEIDQKIESSRVSQTLRLANGMSLRGAHPCFEFYYFCFAEPASTLMCRLLTAMSAGLFWCLSFEMGDVGLIRTNEINSSISSSRQLPPKSSAPGFHEEILHVVHTLKEEVYVEGEIKTIADRGQLVPSCLSDVPIFHNRLFFYHLYFH